MWKEANREEKTGRRRSKKTEEGDKYHRGGRRRAGLNDNFNWTVSSQFLIAADIERGVVETRQGISAVAQGAVR
jgi:hypothetical protein